MKKWKWLFFVLVALLQGPLNGQTLVLDSATNRFLINEPGDTPRLDLVIRSFTDSEKRKIPPVAVIDTLTKPTFETQSNGFHRVHAGRMAEPMTVVVRGGGDLQEGYYFKVNGLRPGPDESVLPIRSYQIGNEQCTAGPQLPFGVDTVSVSLHRADGTLISRLQIDFFYPQPELLYVYVAPLYTMELSDTTKLRRLFPYANRAETTYSAPNAVPDTLSIAENTMYFGFKKAYFDGRVQATRIRYRTHDKGQWMHSVKEVFPYIELEQRADNWTWMEDGAYQLEYSYTGTAGSKGTYPFAVDHHWIFNLGYYAQLLVLIPVMLFTKPWFTALCVLLIAFSIFGNRIRKTRDLAKKANLELQAIQSQLNPHFVFNALSSLQGLINSHEIDRANNYLSGFSKLLRNTLYQSGKEMVPLATEISNLENYLKLEQLRFDFQYEISVDPQIAHLQIEVPALLIQPVVENAIKHGISALGSRGRLALTFSKVNSDILIEIEDNGSGYDGSAGTNGKGLDLTRERIQWLNKSGYSSKMNTVATPTGTTVTFWLKKWL